MKFLLKLSLGIILFIAIARFCRLQTDNFAQEKITSSLAYDPEWDISPLNSLEEKEIKAILNQPFTYLGSGQQCFAFLSKDQKYVLKFLRHDHINSPFWIRLPTPFFMEEKKTEKLKISKQKQKEWFTSFKIAYEDLHEETGMVYLHLNRTDHLKQMITLYDKIGVIHTIPLDEFTFAVQKRADLVYPSLEKYMKEGDTIKAKNAIKGILGVIVQRSQKGIFDKDPNVSTNFGLLDEKALEIDIGRFRREDKRKGHLMEKDELLRITDRFYQWLLTKDPSLASYLQEEASLITAGIE